ncbi:AMP binding enzyme [Rhizoctonia solani]|uniref:AMP binding enzyme n=1 Tax=Rhizoctonia solani TaxID=456999 RepID=A0A8H8SYS7_9AGAM|nr:AMP binding enzyme [Rhizoctonia solani]QRW23561.1 AMP binding enzyme [Rhizoctonia solani]
MTPEFVNPFPKAHPGPSDADPLTDDELSLLLAIPRAAESTPNSTLFRLPLGPHPSMGFVDATCAEVRSIVARLASTWKTKLAELLHKPDEPGCEWSIGPGTTICIMVEPSFHGIFHLLAFWAIGCTIQFVSAVDPEVGITQLNECHCRAMICSGLSEKQIDKWRKGFDGAIIQLPEQEQPHRLVQAEKHGQHNTFYPWPTAQRPTPAFILQSSGTTVLVPFYWPSFYTYLVITLATGTPMAFAYFMDVLRLTGNKIVEWALALDVGAIGCTSGMFRQIPEAMLETHSEFFRSLLSLSFGGSAMDVALSHTLERLKIPVTNVYGSSELGNILIARKAPYTHLTPLRAKPPPLVRPISEYGPDGSRYVELWVLASSSVHITHHLAYGGVPIKLEPFLGDGPHNGEPAFNLEDIFKEITINNASGSGSETVYIHAGRHGDQLRLTGLGVADIDAPLYEGLFTSEANARMVQLDGRPWTVDVVELFGTNMPSTALVIQLHLDQDQDHDLGGGSSSQELPISELFDVVEKSGCEKACISSESGQMSGAWTRIRKTRALQASTLFEYHT